MIDRDARRQLALAVTALIDGKFSTDDFTSVRPNRYDDRGVIKIWFYIYGLYDDLWPRRLKGLSPETRAIIDKCLLFLETDFEYRWPDAWVDLLSDSADDWILRACLFLGFTIIAGMLSQPLVATCILIISVFCFVKSFLFRDSIKRDLCSIMATGASEVWPFFSLDEYNKAMEYRNWNRR